MTTPGVAGPTYHARVSEPRESTTEDLSDLPLYGLDIETDTASDGLDPTRSAVVAVAVWGGPVDRSGHGPHPGPSTAGPGHVEDVLEGEEAALLRRVDETLLHLPPGVLVTWNGRGFDLPFIAARAERLGLTTGLRIDPATGEAVWHRHRHLDGLRTYRADVGRTLGISCALKSLSRFVGLEPVEVDRTRIHDLSAEDLRAYVLSDARLTHTLVARRWPSAAGWVDRTPGGATGSPSPAAEAAAARGA